MARRPWTTRKTVEDCLALDATKLARSGALRKPPGSASVHCWFDSLGRPCQTIRAVIVSQRVIRLEYEASSREVDLTVGILTTPCNFGGLRFWFACPGKSFMHGCGCKTSRLYLPPGSSRFACRRCHNLTYYTAQRHSSKVDRLRKLGPETVAALSLVGNRRVSGLARRALELNAKLAKRRLPLRWLKRLQSYREVFLNRQSPQSKNWTSGPGSSPGDEPG
jgi:hypothetical protein